MKYACCSERRLRAVREAGVRNGVAYVEVLDRHAPSEDLRQRTLYVHLLLPVGGLNGTNVVIEGGQRVPTVAVEWAQSAADPLPAGEQPSLVAGLEAPDRVLLVRTADRGDFSRYTIRLVAGPGDDTPPAGFDPRLAGVEFSFKIECDNPFDCRATESCSPDSVEPPIIDYLAKDYGTFRRLMLDRMSLLAPNWRERSPADAMVTLVELLAYTADQLSYRQDAIATEAYLGTARSRVSLRRHARLVDYLVHDGCNARVWVQVDVAGAGVVLPARTPVLTRVAGVPARVSPGGPEHVAASVGGAATFETVDDAVLYGDHRAFRFYTWGDGDCCLAQGATSATLRGSWPMLRAGDVLVLAEVVSPTTGNPADADPARRCAVRLVSVASGHDPSGGLFDNPPTAAGLDVTEISWDDADALPFPLCISAGGGDLEVGAAWGNIVLADHGETVWEEELGTVPKPRLARVAAGVAMAGCDRPDPEPVPVRFRPVLAKGPLTQAPSFTPPALFDELAPPAVLASFAALSFSTELAAWLRSHGVAFDHAPPVVRGGSPLWSVSDGQTVVGVRATAGRLYVSGRSLAANLVATASPRLARPAVVLSGTYKGADHDWQPRFDLLASDADAREFVVETEHDESARIRFGDDVHGRRPESETTFKATYRVGNGPAGNVGADAIAHVATDDGTILGVRSPLPATGGTDPETADAVRRDAPQAFTVQQRAVTGDDYAEVSQRFSSVQRATSTFRWTGSWYTVFVTADRTAGKPVDPAFETALRDHLERYRMAGYDLEIDGPAFVALEVGVHICVRPDHFRSDVHRALLEVLGSGRRPDGRRGLFHPDNFTFGQPVSLSSIYAAAQAVPGVESVTVNTFRRQHEPQTSGVDAGELRMDRLEIARLDGDPNFPERGTLALAFSGGK